MDGITCGALAAELHRILRDATVERVVMPDHQTVILQLFVPETGKTYISLSANPSYPFFQRGTELPSPLLNPPPAFAMLLRKHLRRARLDSVSAPPGERILSFRFRTINEMGDEYGVTLQFECMPRTANLILLNDEAVILDAIRHIDHTVNREREILPAHPYIPPPSQQRLSAAERIAMPEDGFLSDLKPGLSVLRAAMQAVAGFSPLLGTEAAYRAGLDPDRPLGSLDIDERKRLDDAVRTLCLRIVGGDITPRVYFSEDGEPVAVHVLPLTHLPRYTDFLSVAEAVTFYNRRVLREDLFKRAKTALQSRLRDQIRHARRKQELHEKDALKGDGAALQQLKGELILANIYRIPEGADRVVLENYHADPPEKIEVALNPKRKPAENARLYFEEARRNRRRKEMATALLRKDERALAWLLSLSEALSWAEDDTDLEAVASELRAQTDHPAPAGRPRAISNESDRLPGKPGKRSKRRVKAYAGQRRRRANEQREKGPSPIPPRTLTSSDGFQIFVGRNPSQNDRLLRKARKDDLWLHIKDGAGAHVIVATEGRDVPESTLNEAAGVAAWYSGANRAGGAKTDIDVTYVRDVKKPPRAAPGYVIYKNQKTVRVEPVNPAALRAPTDDVR